MVTIRPASERDLDGLCAVLEHLPFDGPRPVDRASAARVFPTILATPGRVVLVAELDAVIVGTADVIVLANLTRDVRPHALVENVGVAPGLRRKGIGRALVSRAVDHARAAGCYKVQLLSNAHRVEAHALYESIGFEPNATGFRLYF